jgi:hypothetical protein
VERKAEKQSGGKNNQRLEHLITESNHAPESNGENAGGSAAGMERSTMGTNRSLNQHESVPFGSIKLLSTLPN